MDDDRLIVIAGVCGAGKSTLSQSLKALGYHAHTVAQEHSFAPKMWKMTKPDILIYLDAHLETICNRRNIQWGEARLEEQRRRLVHARANCDLFIDTNPINIEDVLQNAVDFLKESFGGGKVIDGDCNI